ncbi:MAG: OmpA family protein [Krumholzibacteria bacterium]|nr:OmpA family protein [Candidatus Krumholzibacteria bacterium]
MARQKKTVVKKGLDGWVMTYGDMMSLLLTFFVLIVSFSSMQEVKFEQAAKSLKEAFGVMATPEAVIELNTPLVPRDTFRESNLEFLYEIRSIEKEVLDRQVQDDVQVEIRDDGVLFRLTAPFLFDSGRAELRGEAAPVLERLARMFRKFPAEVRVEGHTDDLPIRSDRFPSNWELSAARAVSVARYFQAAGLPADRLAATGYGEHRPVAGNDSAEGRTANRRVEILLKWSGKEVPRRGELPLAAPAADPAVPADQDPAAASADAPMIIDPVTGRLGRLPAAGGK